MQDTTGTIIDVFVKAARIAMAVLGWIQSDHRETAMPSIVARKRIRRPQQMELIQSAPISHHHHHTGSCIKMFAIYASLVLGR
jgi:hypothetical protein